MPNFRNLVLHQPLTNSQLRDFSSLTTRGITVAPHLVDAVFEGGGALGAAYTGSLLALERNNIWFARVAGNSAGAITAAMIAAGFKADEIQWLTTAVPPAQRAPRPAGLVRAGIKEPIDFSTFIDLPTINSVSRDSKRRTLLWKALNFSILDTIGNLPVGIPSENDAVKFCMTEIMENALDGALGDAIRLFNTPLGDPEKALQQALEIALSGLPAGTPHIKDFLPDTSALRRALADTAWDAIASAQPLMLAMTNLVYEGSLFEGDVFLSTMKQLLGSKVHGDPNRDVHFDELTIPLAVIASNIRTGDLKVYGSGDGLLPSGSGRRGPVVTVAEAVRRSMSIPFIFQPRGLQQQFVDGGLLSNFPIWLFSAAGAPHWPAASRSNNRLTIGFSLDDNGKPDEPSWQPMAPGKFQLGADGSIDTLEVLRPILEDKLTELGYPQAMVAIDLAAALGVETGDPRTEQEPELALLVELVGVVSNGVMNTEQSTRAIYTEALMSGRAYVDVAIPLSGFHWLDFYVNTEAGSLRRMWDRSWHAAIDQLTAAQAAGYLPAGSVRVAASPFH